MYTLNNSLKVCHFTYVPFSKVSGLLCAKAHDGVKH